MSGFRKSGHILVFGKSLIKFLAVIQVHKTFYRATFMLAIATPFMACPKNFPISTHNGTKNILRFYVVALLWNKR